MHFTREPGALVVVEVGVVHRQHRHRPPASGGKRRHLRGEGGLDGALQARAAVNAGAAGQRIIEAAGDEVGWNAHRDARLRTRGHRPTIADETILIRRTFKHSPLSTPLWTKTWSQAPTHDHHRNTLHQGTLTITST